MQNHFRRLAVFSFAAALVLFGSCERHHVGELEHDGEHAKSDATKYEGPADQKKRDDKHEAGDQQQRATTALTPTPAPTAAQFFPATSPH